MKKIFSFLLLIFLTIPASNLFAMETTGPFPDVPSDHRYASAIEYVKEQGIVSGFSDGTFRPNERITRAALFKMIAEAKFDRNEIDTCLEKNTTGTGNYVFFEDADRTQWYANYVCILKVNEIIHGDKDNMARPAENIIFPEFAKVIMQAYRYTHDSAPSAPWFKVYVDKLREHGAIPMSIQNFQHEMTRDEIAQIIYLLDNDITGRESQSFFTLQEANE